MGADEYHPIGHRGSNLTAAGGIGYTVIDSMDTMLIMGLDAEYQRARKWVEDKLDFDQDANFNTFEVRHTSQIIPWQSAKMLLPPDDHSSSRRITISIQPNW